MIQYAPINIHTARIVSHTVLVFIDRCCPFPLGLFRSSLALGQSYEKELSYPAFDVTLLHGIIFWNHNETKHKNPYAFRKWYIIYAAGWFNIISSIIHDDVIKWKHFPRYWPFCSPVNSPHKGQWRGALLFSLICVWINSSVNNREAGDLRRYRAHYEVIVM